MLLKLFISLSILFLVLFAGSLNAQELTLPIYHLTIDPAYWDSLETNPASPQTYPAELEYEDVTYLCQVRYRGTSTLWLPKKSWKIFFDSDGPGGLQETNLNAEYRDMSLCRNYFSMELSRIFGQPTPDTRHISFMINEQYRGVFLEVEQVDEEFFDSRNLGSGSLFKALYHGARFAPFLYGEDITYNYEPKITGVGSLDTLGARMTFIQNADHDDLIEGLDSMLDESNFLAYFAIQFCIRGIDGFTKNFYIHEYDDGRYMLVPWDCDGTFGNNWEGNWVFGAYNKDFITLNQQAVFQRLISIPEYRDELWTDIDFLRTTGFDSLSVFAVEVYDEIRNDVYLDTFKRGSNEEFEEELERILDFISVRAIFLSWLDWFNRVEAEGNDTRPDYIASPDEVIHFQTSVPQAVHGVSVHVIDSQYNETDIWLVDDGTSGDSIANDLIYTIEVSLEDFTPPYYYCFNVEMFNVGLNETEGYPTPPAGWVMFDLFHLSLPTIRLDDEPPLPDDVAIGDFSQNLSTGTHYFGLINSSDRLLNLSGCVVRLGSTYRLLRLSEMEPVPPGDTLFITNHIDLVTAMKPDALVTGNFYFAHTMGDTIFLETSSGVFLTSAVVDTTYQIEEIVGPVVINEINYNSADDFDPGDWIEIYAREGIHDLSGWTLRDNRDDHIYTIPAGTSLNEGEHLVIAEDTAAFLLLFPNVAPVVGETGYGFSGNGDDVRLFDDSGILIDWVAYDDEAPWPEAPDGDGPTLELIDPSLPNFNHENWQASTWSFPHGTPGECNSVSVVTNPPPLFINEFMADNNTTILDPQGEYDDWLEIWNCGNEPVNLGGMHLTDELSNPDKWIFPDTILSAGAFILIWADDDEGDPGLHTNFRLSADGEEIGLFGDETSGLMLIDSVTFGPQAQDVSYGRNPDGGTMWQTFLPSTPGYSNAAITLPEVEDLVISIEEDSTVHLSWSPLPSAQLYKVYRADEPHFEPSAEYLLGDTTEPEYFDQGILNISNSLYYRVTVVIDYWGMGNESMKELKYNISPFVREIKNPPQ